ncbi:unnamed protein product [Sphagnum balticum]
MWEPGGSSLRSLLLHVLRRSPWLGSRVKLPWWVPACLRGSPLEAMGMSLGPSLRSRSGGCFGELALPKESAAWMSSTSPSSFAMMVSAFAFRNCSCRSGNWIFIVCSRSASAPYALASKLGVYLEKERLSPLHSTVVSFLVDMAPSSFSKKIRK